MLLVHQKLLERVVLVVIFCLPGHELIAGQVLVEGRDITSDAFGGAAVEAIELNLRILDDRVTRAIWFRANKDVILLGGQSLLGHPVLGHILFVENDRGVDMSQGLVAAVLKARDDSGGVDERHDVQFGTCPAA